VSRLKILQVAAVDEHVQRFMLPLVDGLKAEGYQVHIACSDGRYVSELRSKGFVLHTVPIDRRLNPLSLLKALWRLYRLIRTERYDVVHVHTPVAAALGRVAAWAANTPIVINTVWAFYFHDQTPQWKRKPMIWAERLLDHLTDLEFFAVNEDAVTAVKERICSQEKTVIIGTGINTKRFANLPSSSSSKASFGFHDQDKVIGFVGRLVAEKGLLELADVMKGVVESVPNAKLLVVGDALKSDRDQTAKQIFLSKIRDYGIDNQCVLTGVVEDIPRVMAAIDVLAHPSHRDGVGAPILEAMASGKPVVVNNIRGFRESVTQGVNGLLVPPLNPKAMAEALIAVLQNPAISHKFGNEGQRIARDLFDERIIVSRQMASYAAIAHRKLPNGHIEEPRYVRKAIQGTIKRFTDIFLSTIGLIILFIPFLIVATCIKLDSRGPFFFHHERIGKFGRPFYEWKFRTMIEGAMNQGLGVNIVKNDVRITRIGLILREFSIDELPQLINVLIGEMSLVGPRPLFRAQVERYNDFQSQRLTVKPGLTGLAIVNGRNLLPMKKRIMLDIWYARHWSLWLDTQILAKTLWVVIAGRRGVYAKGGANDDLLAKYMEPDPKQLHLKEPPHKVETIE
jgi:lipopolysaccharide/colanic/teichoic acid biosynthesis glycosyltransferase/glycosyltransferase involved in cell wall biosynthesis